MLLGAAKGPGGASHDIGRDFFIGNEDSYTFLLEKFSLWFSVGD